jgi:hypothetical protein
MYKTCQGTEIEFAGVGTAADGNERAVMALADAVRSHFAHLPHNCIELSGHGMFLGNGSRWYIDCGMHPESSTPECRSPLDLVIWEKASERIMETASGLASEALKQEVTAFKNNIDYLHGSTWGCHESLCYKRSAIRAQELRARLVPFLATRPIFAGAGAISPDAHSTGFELSARARFLRHATSSESTRDRGVWHSKDEPLCDGGYARLHNLSGDSLLSEFGLYLRAGTFALLVAALEAGCEVGAGLALEAPVAAMQAVSRGAGEAVRIDLADGRQLTAIEIQSEYLRQVRPFAEGASAPDWMADICRKWESVLAALAREPEALCGLLDAYAKRAAYGRTLERQGLTWNGLRDWAHVIEAVVGCLEAPLQVRPGHVRERVREAVPASHFASVSDYMESRGMTWDLLLPMFKAYRSLQEIDVRYADVRREAGGFHRLRRSGFLRDRLVSESDIERAMHEPPTGTRAKARGEAIRDCAAAGASGYAGWDFVQRENRVLRLDDPFAVDAAWSAARGVDAASQDLFRRLRRRRRRAGAEPPGDPPQAPQTGDQ